MTNKILIVSALKEEVESLSGDFEIILTGIGKVNAAINLQTELFALKSQNKLPDVVVNYGTAGKASDRVEVGMVYEIGNFLQRDMVITELGIEKYQTSFEQTSLIKNKRGSLVCGTGDNFWSSNETSDFDVVDMEAYALALVCKRINIPFRCFKFISDSGNIKEWEQNVNKGTKSFESTIRELYRTECSV